jgi:hypothetical protein
MSVIFSRLAAIAAFVYSAVSAMKLSIIAAAGFCLILGPAQAREPLDGIAAVVNNEVITFEEVRKLTADSEAQAKRGLRGEALNSKLKQIRLAAIRDLFEKKRTDQKR